MHNGDLATVIKVTTADKSARRPAESVTVKLDSGEVRYRASVGVGVAVGYDANNLTLGYCVTTHKAQGATVESTYVFSYGAMTDAEMAYVQASRARDKTRIYTTKDEAGPELSRPRGGHEPESQEGDGPRRDRGRSSTSTRQGRQERGD